MFAVRRLHKSQNAYLNLIQIRFKHDNHYDVLKLKRDCTTNEIRQAFIKLSKEHHPDLQKSKDSHVEYVKIIEAYKVLSRPKTRAEYDLSLLRLKAPGEYDPSGVRPGTYYPNETYYYPRRAGAYYYSREYQYGYEDPVRKAWADPSFYANRQHRQRQHEKAYQNLPPLVMFFSFMGIVCTIYVFTMWNFFVEMKEANYAKDQYAAYLEEVRKRAEESTKEEQIERLKNRNKDTK